MSGTFKLARPGLRAGILMAAGAISLSLCFSVPPVPVGAAVPSMAVQSSADLETALRWIQPLLGRAIVEDAVIRQPFGIRNGNKIDDIDQRPAVTYHTAGMTSDRRTSVHLAARELDHASRVQWIMGRLIVELTGHRLVAPGRPADEGSRRIIAIVRLVEEEWNDALRTGANAGPGRAAATHALNRGLAPSPIPESSLVF